MLRTSRFFPEDDDVAERRAAHDADNLKLNELLHRRVDIDDVVDAHLLAIDRAATIGFGRYIVSATSPFTEADLAMLVTDPAGVVARRVPDHVAEYVRRGWTMLDAIDRVYVNARARDELGWRPKHDFASGIARLARGEDFRSALTHLIGVKGYHRTA